MVTAGNILRFVRDFARIGLDQRTALNNAKKTESQIRPAVMNTQFSSGEIQQTRALPATQQKHLSEKRNCLRRA